MTQGYVFVLGELRPWQVLTAGISALVLTVGLARFAYTPMLPLMQQQAGVSDLLGGWMATINYAGYMTGTLLATAIHDPRAKLRLYRAGLVAGVIGTAGMGLVTNPWLWLLLRYIAGISAAAGMLLGSGMILAWLVKQGRRPELGIHFTGMGLGIAISGMLVAFSSRHLDWAQQWQLMGVLGMVLLVPGWFWMPCVSPHATGQPISPAPTPAATASRSAWLLVAAYFCAGVGYVVSATFIVAATEKQPALAGLGPTVWIVVGLAAMPATLIWDRLARTAGDVATILVAYALQIASIILTMTSGSLISAMIGAVLFGATFIGIVALTLTLAGKRNRDNPSRAMARLTLSYGAAQIIAPAIVGIIAEKTGSYNAGLLMAAAALVVGMVLMICFGRRPVSS